MKDEEWSVTRIVKELEDEVKAREKTAQTSKGIGDRRPSKPTGATLYTSGKKYELLLLWRTWPFS